MNKSKKIIFLVLIGIVLGSKIAMADLFGIGDIAAKAIGSIAFIIIWIISKIAGIAIAIESFLISIILQLNQSIVQSDLVQSGFSISLAVANLFFVAGIIVIAISTILRVESYNIKNLLGKLILMAILVNFGLTIAGALIEISNNFSFYFLSQLGGVGSDKFIDAIMNVFNVQNFFMQKPPDNTNSNIANEAEKSIPKMIGGGIGELLAPITAVFFTVVFLLYIIVILGALGIMFLIRYLSLSFLLILLPLAWALSIFPKFKEYNDKWWGPFINWIIFAPVSFFFIYLCLLTMQGAGSPNNPNQYTINNITFSFDTSGVIGGIKEFAGSLIISLIVPILKAIILGSCLLGSLMVGQKLGVAGSKEILGKTENLLRGWGKNIGMSPVRKVGGATGRKILGSKPVNKLREKLQSASTASLKQDKWYKKAFTRPAGLAAGYLGRGIEKAQKATREDAIEKAKKDIEKMNSQELANNLGIMSQAQRIAAIEKLQSEGKLGLVKDLESLLDENSFKKFNKGSLFKKIKDQSGLSIKENVEKILELQRAGKDENSEDYKSAYEAIKDNMMNITGPDLWAKFFSEDTPVKLADEQKSAIQELILKAMFKDGVATKDELNDMFKNLKSNRGLGTFIDTYRKSGIKLEDMDEDVADYIGNSTGSVATVMRKTLGIPKKEKDKKEEDKKEEPLIVASTNLSDEAIEKAKKEGEKRRGGLIT